MNVISPFRVTEEDLAELDGKTRAGLAPLFESLNVSMQQLVAALGAAPEVAVVPVTLSTDASVASSFPLVFKHGLGSTPRWVGMVCVPKDPDHSLASPFVMQGFSITQAGLVSVPWITGLLASNTYNLSFLVHS